jgi:co-chaperonin GroES (HSP10)
MDIRPEIGADNIRPILDRILVRCDKEKFATMTDGGIYIPENVRHSEQCIGTVVSIGPGRWRTTPPFKNQFIATYIKPGDRVLFAMEGAEPLSWLDDDIYHYEMIVSEIYILGSL